MTDAFDRTVRMPDETAVLIPHVWVLIAEAAFDDDSPWLLETPAGTMRAEMADENFRRSIREGRARFSQGDRLDADMRLTLTEKGNQTVMHWTIVRVHAHRRPRSAARP